MQTERSHGKTVWKASKENPQSLELAEGFSFIAVMFQTWYDHIKVSKSVDFLAELAKVNPEA